MSAFAHSLIDSPAPAVAPVPESTDRTLDLCLDAGGAAVPVRVRYRLAGRAGAPVVLVLGGLNSGRDLADWWPAQSGPGRPLDPGRFRLLSLDWAEATAAAHETAGPLLTHDQAQAIEQILAHHGIECLHAVVGASFGAMVGLALAERRQVAMGHLLLISGAHCSHPVATAVRHLQREIVRLGEVAGLPRSGLAIARGLAMISYRSPALFAERFAQPEASTRLDALESYLAHVGIRFAQRFSSARFLALSEALDRHQVDPARVRCPVTLVAVASDQLVPLSQMQTLAEALPGRLHVIESDYGHDAFLTEHAAIGRVLNDCLKETHHVTA